MICLEDRLECKKVQQIIKVAHHTPTLYIATLFVITIDMTLSLISNCDLVYTYAYI